MEILIKMTIFSSSRAAPSQQKELESRIIRWISEKERKGRPVGGTQIKAQVLKFDISLFWTLFAEQQGPNYLGESLK